MFQHHVLKRVSFYQCIYAFVKNQLNVVLFLGSPFCPIDLLSIFSWTPHCLDCNFVVSLEVPWCQLSDFILLFHNCVGYSGFFAFSYKLQNQYICIHKVWWSLIVITFSLYIKLGRTDILIILSASILWTWNISTFIYSSFDFFYQNL